jgi:Periplasmic glucan biosynthesis protein, MdoG
MKTHLFFGLLTVVLLIIVIGSRRQEAFTFDDVIGMAQAIAAGRRLSTAPVLPKELRDLNYDQHRAIRWKDEYTLWRREGLPLRTIIRRDMGCCNATGTSTTIRISKLSITRGQAFGCNLSTASIREQCA